MQSTLMLPITLPGKLRNAIADAIPLLRGWAGKTMRPYRMASLILQEQPKVVVEIGVFGGQSLVPQAMALKYNGAGRIYGIDPYNLVVVMEEMAELDDKDGWLRQDMNVIRESTLKSIWDFGLRDQVVMILAESRHCSTLFDSIDILHIDGAHTEQGALLDVNLYAKRVRSGGYIWMDDTHFPSLQPALRELENFADVVEDFIGYRLYKVR